MWKIGTELCGNSVCKYVYGKFTCSLLTPCCQKSVPMYNIFQNTKFTDKRVMVLSEKCPTLFHRNIYLVKTQVIILQKHYRIMTKCYTLIFHNHILTHLDAPWTAKDLRNAPALLTDSNLPPTARKHTAVYLVSDSSSTCSNSSNILQPANSHQSLTMKAWYQQPGGSSIKNSMDARYLAKSGTLSPSKSFSDFQQHRPKHCQQNGTSSMKSDTPSLNYRSVHKSTTARATKTNIPHMRHSLSEPS